MSRLIAITISVFFFSNAQAADLPETPNTTIALCRTAIEQWAEQFHPISIDTTVIRPERTTSEGRRIELAVQVVYDSQGGHETRKAEIGCTVDPSGSVAVAELTH